MGSDLGSYLKSTRTKKRLSLRKVEESTSISNAYLSQLENGKIENPSPSILHKIASTYQVSYSKLMVLAGHPIGDGDGSLSEGGPTRPKTPSPYIPPRISGYASAEELIEAWKDPATSRRFLFEEETAEPHLFSGLHAHQKLLILADPGYGKSRLLREYAQHLLQTTGTLGVVVDLKRYPRGKLQDLVTESAGGDLSFKELVAQSPVLCFDAIDELKRDHLQQFLDEFRALIVKYSSLRLVVTCRLLSYQRERVLEACGFRYLLISEFDFDDVRAYLAGVLSEEGRRLFSDQEIDDILHAFSEPNWESIILIPRYLEKFIEYRKRHPHWRPTRSTLYDFFVNERLQIEDHKRGAQDQLLIRRLLEKIALLMEIRQVNELSKDDLLTIMEDVDSNLAGHFLDLGKLGILFDHSLWKDYGDSIAFEDHTLQEYLASREFLHLGGQRRLYELAVNQEIDEVHPSWFNTLGFCVDQDVSLLEPLALFGEQKKQRIVESEEYHRFLTKIDVTKLSTEQRRTIFAKVFGQYERECVWIPWDIAKRLALFFEPDHEVYLRACVQTPRDQITESARYVPWGNAAEMIGLILRRGQLGPDSIAFWKAKLIEFANDDNENGVLQRHALFALEVFRGEVSILEAVRKTARHPSELVREAFVSLCEEVAPNSQVAIETFLHGAAQRSYHALSGLAKVNDSDALKFVLQRLSEDNYFLQGLTRHETRHLNRREGFLRNVEAAYDDRMGVLLLQIICKAADKLRQNTWFVKEIAQILINKRPTACLEICDYIIAQQAKAHLIFELEQVLAELIQPSMVKDVADRLMRLPHGDFRLFELFTLTKRQRGQVGEQLYELGRAVIPDTYREFEAKQAQQSHTAMEEDRIYRGFQRKLSPAPEKYMTDLFQYYQSHQAEIDRRISEGERDELIALIVKHLHEVDSRKANFKVLEWSPEGTIRQFRWSSSLSTFDDCVRLMLHFQIPMDERIRSNLVGFIPFAESEACKVILELLGQVRPDDLTYLIGVYGSDSERKYFRAINFINVAKQAQSPVCHEVLKAFVKEQRFHNYDRREALKCLVDIGVNCEYLIQVFKQNLGNNDALAEAANAYLIEKYRDPEAVRWRLAQIGSRAASFQEPVGGHAVGPLEHELHSHEFAQPLMTLADRAWVDDYVKLLDFSIDLLERRGKTYWAYAEYIWIIVVNYITNLKHEGDYEPVRRIEAFVEKNSLREGVNWLGNRLKTVQAEYRRHIGVPRTIADCIRLYNAVKAKQYDLIGSQRELRGLVRQVLDKQLREWIETEGARDLFYTGDQDPVPEPKISKVIAVKLEHELEKYGITVCRERHKWDDKRVDFYLSFGFSPSIRMVIEVKKSDNELGPKLDLSRTRSFISFQEYMVGFKADCGFFLVINVDRNGKSWQALIHNTKKHYETIRDVEVIGINALN